MSRKVGKFGHEMPRLLGTVKWFNDKDKFGFINPDNDESIDVFAHRNDIKTNGFRSLIQGERVEFDMIDTPKGKKALRIVRINSKLSSLDG